jgi:hypothetical protein
MQAYNRQMHEFCQMMQEEVLKHWNHMPPRPTSVEGAREFTESFLLCPTQDAARACIARDFSGALNFVMALNHVTIRMGDGRYQMAEKWPEHQTRYYKLASTVLDFIDTQGSTVPTVPTQTETVQA